MSHQNGIRSNLKKLIVTTLNLDGLAPERIADDEPLFGSGLGLDSVDALELEVGYGLLPLIDTDKGGELPGRVTNLRRQIATELGLVLPPVHLRDNLRLDSNEYRIKMRGVEVGRGVAHADRIMALDPVGASPRVDGVDGEELPTGVEHAYRVRLPGDRQHDPVRRPQRAGDI